MDQKLTTMNWDDLRVFLAVENAGSIRGAAKAIGTTHATVSRHVQALEGNLKGALFERRREGQCLTELGKRILPLARQVEDAVVAIDRAAFSADTGLAGSVTLSLSESLYLALLYKPIDEFMRRFPMIDLNVAATDKLTKLAWREADVVIRITKSPPVSAFGKKIAESPMTLYASSRYLAERPKLDRWISLDYGPSRKPTIPARIAATADTSALAVQMIKMGQGVAMLPCYIGDTDPDLIRVPNTELVPDMQIWILTHSDLRSNPRVRALMDHLYDAFGDFKSIIEGQKSDG